VSRFGRIKCNSKERKSMKQKLLQAMFAVLLIANANAQVNSGSNGSDGAFNPTANIVINMADHPNGIYQYSSVNIPNGVTVTFIPNANNSPVTWLVQNGVTINGAVNVSGQNANGATGGTGGPGGWNGGIYAGQGQATSGQGPGGGVAGSNNVGGQYNYGNQFLIPLLGGSGGAGSTGGGGGGGGGGGAILIAASNSISIAGSIVAYGGGGNSNGGNGSGGAIRLIASQITGSGIVYVIGASNGRIRFDTFDNEFSGGVQGQFTSGSQFVTIPTAGQIPQLTVASVGGVPVSASPTGVLSTPDAVISAQQSNPMPVVVNCTNLPLGSSITVTIVPISGSSVSAVGSNNTGTLASSTATISITIPRGGGLIYATATTGN
jgi:hypothetical protein